MYFHELMSRAESWHLPEKWNLIIRVTDSETGKVTEQAFASKDAAYEYTSQLNPNDEVVGYDNSFMQDNYTVRTEYQYDR